MNKINQLGLQAALEELVAASKNMKAVARQFNRLQKKYPCGTCNCEDAWNEYSKDNAKAERRFNLAIRLAEKELQ